MSPPRRWHATTLNDQFGTFGDAVSEYSFELTPDAVLTCGALAVHPGVRGPKTGGKWGHLFLFPDEPTRDSELVRYVHRHRRATVRRFLLRNPLKSTTLAGDALWKTESGLAPAEAVGRGALAAHRRRSG